MKKFKLKLIITFIQTTTNQHNSKQNLPLKIPTPQRVCFFVEAGIASSIALLISSSVRLSNLSAMILFFRLTMDGELK